MSNPETLQLTVKLIQDSWGMSDEQIAALIHVDLQIYSSWMIDRTPSEDSPTIPRGMDNAVALASIYQSLKRRYPKTEDQVKWLFTQHPDFGQNKPIDIAASSAENLFWLSYYLASSPKASDNHKEILS